VANSLQRVEYYYVTVEDKRGEGYWVLEYFFQKGVNFLSFTAFPLGAGRSQLDFIPSDPETLVAAAKEAHIELIGPKRAFLLLGDDQPGGIIDIHRKLSNAEINVHAANGIATGDGKFGMILWVKPDDYELAAVALGI
jgi:hypothetical protein